LQQSGRQPKLELYVFAAKADSSHFCALAVSKRSVSLLRMLHLLISIKIVSVYLIPDLERQLEERGVVQIARRGQDLPSAWLDHEEMRI
jgi:hypothetical protein